MQIALLDEVKRFVDDQFDIAVSQGLEPIIMAIGYYKIDLPPAGAQQITRGNQRQMIGIQKPFESDTETLHDGVRRNPARHSQCAMVLRRCCQLHCGYSSSGFRSSCRG